MFNPVSNITELFKQIRNTANKMVQSTVNNKTKKLLYSLKNLTCNHSVAHYAFTNQYGHPMDIFTALADVQRRNIIEALHQRSNQSIKQLTINSSVSRQAITKHLNILIKAKIV